jgi:hypothetical protein
MNLEQFQPPTWHSLNCKTTQMYILANMEYKHSKLWLMTCCFWYCHLIIFHNNTQLMSYVHGFSSRFVNEDSGCHNPLLKNWIWSEDNRTQAHQLGIVMLSPQVHIPNYFGQVVCPIIRKMSVVCYTHTKVRTLTIPNGHVWDYQLSPIV